MISCPNTRQPKQLNHLSLSLLVLFTIPLNALKFLSFQITQKTDKGMSLAISVFSLPHPRPKFPPQSNQPVPSRFLPSHTHLAISIMKYLETADHLLRATWLLEMIDTWLLEPNCYCFIQLSSLFNDIIRFQDKCENSLQDVRVVTQVVSMICAQFLGEVMFLI